MRFLGKSERVPRVPGRRGRRSRRCGRSRDGAQRCVMGTKAHDHDSECGSNACGERTATRQRRTTRTERKVRKKQRKRGGRSRACSSRTHDRAASEHLGAAQVGLISRNGAKRFGAVQQVVFANVPRSCLRALRTANTAHQAARRTDEGDIREQVGSGSIEIKSEKKKKRHGRRGPFKVRFPLATAAF